MFLHPRSRKIPDFDRNYRFILPQDLDFPEFHNFTQMDQSSNCLDMLMQDTFQTHIRLDHKQNMCLIVMELLFHGDPLSRQW